MNEEPIALCGLSQRMCAEYSVSSDTRGRSRVQDHLFFFFFCQRKAKEKEELEIGGCSSVEL